MFCCSDGGLGDVVIPAFSVGSGDVLLGGGLCRVIMPRVSALLVF